MSFVKKYMKKGIEVIIPKRPPPMMFLIYFFMLYIIGRLDRKYKHIVAITRAPVYLAKNPKTASGNARQKYFWFVSIPLIKKYKDQITNVIEGISKVPLATHLKLMIKQEYKIVPKIAILLLNFNFKIQYIPAIAKKQNIPLIIIIVEISTNPILKNIDVRKGISGER